MGELEWIKGQGLIRKSLTPLICSSLHIKRYRIKDNFASASIAGKMHCRPIRFLEKVNNDYAYFVDVIH